MVERSIARILLILGGGLIFYGTRLLQVSSAGEEGMRLFTAGLMLGISLIVMAAIIDSDRRRHAQILEPVAPTERDEAPGP